MSMSKGVRSRSFRWSSVSLAANDRTDAAIAKPETPFVRVDKLDDQISGNAWRAFHLDKKRLRARDRLRRLRASGGTLFAFSAKTRSVGKIALVGKANAKKTDESGFPDEGKNFPDRPI
jgi:hypothetical protein